MKGLQAPNQPGEKLTSKYDQSLTNEGSTNQQSSQYQTMSYNNDHRNGQKTHKDKSVTLSYNKQYSEDRHKRMVSPGSDSRQPNFFMQQKGNSI